MLKQLNFESLVKGKLVAGVEIQFSVTGNMLIRCVVLKRNKSDLVIEKQSTLLSSIEELAAFVDPKIPLSILVTGKGIVHRKIYFSETDSDLSLLNKALPNANLSDFNIQKTVIDETQLFISVIRSSQLNELLEELQKHKLSALASFSAGPFAINAVLPLIASTEQTLNLNTCRLAINNSQITGITNEGMETEELTDIGGEHVKTNLLLSYAAAVAYFTGPENPVLNSGTVYALIEENREKRKLQFRSMAVLLNVFAIVMANLVLFNTYWDRSNELSTQLLINQSSVQRCDTLKKELDLKRSFLEQNGLLENSRTSYYADQLAQSLPASIQLNDLSVHPLKKKDNAVEDSGIYFETKMLSVSGHAKKSTELNEWMKVLKQARWISDVTLLNYRQDKKMAAGVFTIQIKLK